MSTLDKVRKIVTEEKKILSEKYNVAKVGVFGSVVRGEEKEGSDIDLIADFSEPISLLELVDLESYLSDKLGRKVEIASRKYLSVYIKDRVLKEEQVIYG